MTLKIASWNVNSIKMRLDHVKTWINDNNPDFLFLQELKALDFPADDFTSLGYHSAVVPQKAYNGVAILSKHPYEIVLKALPDIDPSSNEDDDQARYIEIASQTIRLINIYLPNGNPVIGDDDQFSEKFLYKIKWMERLYAHLKTLRAQQIPFIVGGDFNIIPDALDCYDEKLWQGDALFHPLSLEKWRAILNLGLYDAFRIFHKDGLYYTFWDYQKGAWQKNDGIRIDHFLLSPALTDRLISCQIDKKPRGLEKASDHTPIILECV